MESSWTRALGDSISETLSTMFFLVPETDPGLPAALAGQSTEGWIEGRVDIAGPERRVSVWVWTPGALARELAANILSCDPGQVAGDDLLDAYREMLNMVAGSFLTRVDRESRYRMGLPQARLLGPGRLEDFGREVGELLAYDTEGRPLLAGLKQA